MTWILYLIVAVFVVYEAVAHFIYHNGKLETLSHLILLFEEKHGLKARILVAIVVLLLGVHLEGAF